MAGGSLCSGPAARWLRGRRTPRLGWAALTGAAARLFDADHYSLLQEPALDRLVEHLQSDLAAVEGGPLAEIQTPSLLGSAIDG